jgi:hypothetical protein
MNRDRLLMILSLVLILLFMFHLTDDIVHGYEPGGLGDLIGGVAILVVYLYGAIMLNNRLSGYIIMLLGALVSMSAPVLHMKGAGVGDIARSAGGFFFVWTMLALGLTGAFSAILSAQGIWSLLRARRAPRE